INGLKFFNTGEPGTPFSFFRSIFWNNELAFNSRDGQQIFRHELFHVQQKHSTDIILTELVTALFWVNPFFHILKKELKAIHEFLADQYAISGNNRYDYAELLVLQTIKANYSLITNHFFQNHIKRRIAMITNNQSACLSYRSRLMALPVLAMVFCSIALHAQPRTSEDNNIGAKKPLTILVDAGHGGIDPGAQTKDGKAKEKDLTLQISQKIQQLAAAYNVNVVMSRTDDNLPGGTTNIHEGLRARTALAEKIKPDMYISIHVSFSDEPVTTRTGFEIYVPNDTTQRVNQSKQLGSVINRELGKLYATNQTLKQRKDQNIWVLQRTPCPAVLIECGFLNNDKDLAYFSDPGNQEAVAKKILEGIVNYKNQPMSIIPGGANFSDSILYKLTKHFNRNTGYPKQALGNNAEGDVYFSVAVDENGKVGNLKFYKQAPAEAKTINNLTTVYLVNNTPPTSTASLTKEELQKQLQEEVKKVYDNKPRVTELDRLPPAQYFFKASFRLEKTNTPTT
ncbi:MAG: N-acetylmuramoyl-L-alanine amidase, partial [Niastella sp.]|uniref:N-acetylmuramoyl-L-alanine amidase n=1 Tax=Niastella sp. TaxID=1869183 RepID=UPI00389A896C